MSAERDTSSTAPGVTLVVSALVCGGAERVLANMAAYWVRRGRPVTVITLFSRERDFFRLDERIKRVDLGLRGNPRQSRTLAVGALRSFRPLRRALRGAGHPLVISFLTRTNLLVLMAAWRLPVKIIASEHTDPRARSMGRLVEMLRRRLYRRAAAVTVLTPSVKTEWADRFLAPGRAVVLPNPVQAPEEAGGLPPTRVPARYLVTMGRLVPDKGHLPLIEAFAAIADRFPDVSLLILGEGPERETLERRAAERGLADRVLLPGAVRGASSLLRGAAAFVLSSRREGFPMALAEAMSSGTPCISFDCASGPAEMIRDGEDGILVPPGDTQELARAMADLLADPERAAVLGANAKRNIRDRFAPDIIMGQWDALLRKCLERERP